MPIRASAQGPAQTHWWLTNFLRLETYAAHILHTTFTTGTTFIQIQNKGWKISPHFIIEKEAVLLLIKPSSMLIIKCTPSEVNSCIYKSSYWHCLSKSSHHSGTLGLDLIWKRVRVPTLIIIRVRVPTLIIIWWNLKDEFSNSLYQYCSHTEERFWMQKTLCSHGILGGRCLLTFNICFLMAAVIIKQDWQVK